ncbi:N-acetyl sugar amidotransferase [Candidatus Woesearchaeota archaeon]|nr:N-acetyl sugar amidotransferase [Candidatus Woesearchaeota archaeon]
MQKEQEQIIEDQLEAYYGLPKTVSFCRRCVISNQRPSSAVEREHTIKTKKDTIHFDGEGICDACRFNEHKKNIDWKKREDELKKLCDKHRRHDGGYDCIVPGSGGKDSVFTAHILKYKYGMHPLTVTWAPHIYTEIGWKNFQNWIHSGFDNALITPNGKIHRLLTRLAFINIGHPFQPFMMGQKYIAPKFSLMYNIPLIFYGENEAEYGNRIKQGDSPVMDMKFFSFEGDKIDLTKIFLGGVSVPDLQKKQGVELNDLWWYLPPKKSDLQKGGVEVHYLGYYLRWDPQEVYYYAAENCGFKANPFRRDGTYSKYASLDDKMDDLQFYTTFVKFGIGKATYDAAQEIRNGKITREEGVRLVKKFDGEFPARYHQEILEYLDMTDEEFTATIDKFRSPHLWKKEDGKWTLRAQVENNEEDYNKPDSSQKKEYEMSKEYT